MTKYNLCRITLAFMLLTFTLGNVAYTQPQQPNIVLVMTDDQGWGDVEFSQQLSPSPDNPADQTFVGHPELKTPELSAMAAAGIKFDRFYSGGPVCSPTRACFLTGRHNRRTRVDNANNGHLRNREITIAEIAKMQGYQTGHFGKWHLGTLDKSVFAIDSNRGGTDRLPNSANDYSTPWNDAYDVVFATESRTQTFNPTDVDLDTRYWTDFGQALALSDPTLNGDDSRIIMDQVVPFLESSVAANKPFMATVWFHTPHKPFDTIDTATLNEFYTAQEQAAMTTDERGYYSALTAMDKQVGRLRQTLQQLGVADNTILLFTSDNGPEDGVPFINGIAKGNLRGNKRDLFEGGVRVPAIIEWPGQVVAGSSCDAIAGVIDLLPTLNEIWGFEMPDNRPLDGESILPILTGGATERNGSMYWEYVNSRSIVDSAGRFKAISNNGGSTWELYDLLADPKEQINLANSNPQQLDDLIAEWEDWRFGVESHRAVEGDYNDLIAEVENAVIDTSSPANFLAAEFPTTSPVVVLEKQYFTLQSPAVVNADGTPATYDVNNQPGFGTIDSGTFVHSFLLHFAPSTASDSQCSVTFDNEILGVISSEQLLGPSDGFAFANPTFARTLIGTGVRGLDLHDPNSGDSWTISADRKTITANFETAAGAIDELRILTSTQSVGSDPEQSVVPSISDARLVGFTTDSRDDNNGGGSVNLIGINTLGIDNFALYEFDFERLVGETALGANVIVTSLILNNANHGSPQDFIVINELATTNTEYETGSGSITGSDNMTNDGSVSFLNRVQYNDNPGPALGTSIPWLDQDGNAVANILGAMTPVAEVGGYGLLETPTLEFSIDRETAQRWIDTGVTGLVISTDDNGDSRSRYNMGSAVIVFEIENSLLGDINCDGTVDLLDVGPFVDALSSSQFNPKADVNQDGTVDLLDVGPFVDLLSAG